MVESCAESAACQLRVASCHYNLPLLARSYKLPQFACACLYLSVLANSHKLPVLVCACLLLVASCQIESIAAASGPSILIAAVSVEKRCN